MYKTRLPLVLCFNKIDIAGNDKCLKWLADFDNLDEALQEYKSYMSSLTWSMGLVLEEFYNDLNSCGVSAVTGIGMKQFMDSV